MNEFFARWATESPKFFKRLGTWGKWITGAGAAIIAAKLTAPELIHKGFLNVLELVATYMVFGGGLIVIVSGLTVNDQEAMEQKMKK